MALEICVSKEIVTLFANLYTRTLADVKSCTIIYGLLVNFIKMVGCFGINLLNEVLAHSNCAFVFILPRVYTYAYMYKVVIALCKINRKFVLRFLFLI